MKKKLLVFLILNYFLINSTEYYSSQEAYNKYCKDKVEAGNELLKNFPLIAKDLIPSVSGYSICTRSEFESNSRKLLNLCKKLNSFTKVQVLLKVGVDINAKDRNNMTPLMFAADRGNHQVVELLIKHAADVNFSNKWGWTALLYAAYRGHRSIVELLINSHATINVRNNDGWTPLMYAVYQRNKSVMQLLIGASDLNAQDVNGWTALMYAADKADKEITELLINYGADATIQNHKNETALACAIRSGCKEVIDLLESKK